jgi:hypothetical protein
VWCCVGNTADGGRRRIGMDQDGIDATRRQAIGLTAMASWIGTRKLNRANRYVVGGEYDLTGTVRRMGFTLSRSCVFVPSVNDCLVLLLLLLLLSGLSR